MSRRPAAEHNASHVHQPMENNPAEEEKQGAWCEFCLPVDGFPQTLFKLSAHVTF